MNAFDLLQEFDERTKKTKNQLNFLFEFSKRKHNYHLKIIIQNRLKIETTTTFWRRVNVVFARNRSFSFLDKSVFSSKIDCLFFSNKRDDKRELRQESNEDSDLDDDKSTISRCDVKDWAFFLSSNESLKKLLNETRLSFALFSLCIDFSSLFVSLLFDLTTSFFETFVNSIFFFLNDSNDSFSTIFLFSSKLVSFSF
jgi:hypothetical protein